MAKHFFLLVPVVANCMYNGRSDSNASCSYLNWARRPYISITANISLSDCGIWRSPLQVLTLPNVGKYKSYLLNVNAYNITYSQKITNPT